MQWYHERENLVCGIPTLTVVLTFKENILTVTWKRVHRVKRTHALVCVDMDAGAGNSCAGTVAYIWAAKITTFAVVRDFIVSRASFLLGSGARSHINAEGMVVLVSLTDKLHVILAWDF